MTLVGAIASLQTPGPYKVTRATAGEYVRGRYSPLGPTELVVADTVEAVDALLDALTMTAHGLTTGDGPVRLTTTGTLPGGLALATDYWIVRRDDDQVKLASSLANAQAFPEPVVVDVLDAGSGTHSVASTVDAVRQNVLVFPIVASVQPVTGRMLDEMPEGESASETRIVYTTTLMQTRVPGFEADVVELDDEDYYAIRVDRWQAFGGTHYRAWVSRTAVP